MSREIQANKQTSTWDYSLGQLSSIITARRTWQHRQVLGRTWSQRLCFWPITNTDLNVSRTIHAEKKKRNCQRCLASILYLRTFLTSLEFLCTYCKMMCIVFGLRIVSLAIWTNTNCQSAQGRSLNTLGAANTCWTEFQTANPRQLKASSRWPAPGLWNRCPTTLLLQIGNLLMHWWSVRGIYRVSIRNKTNKKSHCSESEEGKNLKIKWKKKKRVKTPQTPSLKEGSMTVAGIFGTRICTTVRECWHWTGLLKGLIRARQVCTEFSSRMSAIIITTRKKQTRLCIQNYPSISEPWQVAHQGHQGGWREKLLMGKEYVFVSQMRHICRYNDSGKSLLEK